MFFFEIQKMCEVDQETTLSSPPRAGCHHWATGLCLSPSPLLDAEVALRGEGGQGEVCRIRMDRHIRRPLPAMGRSQHHTVKGKPMRRP